MMDRRVVWKLLRHPSLWVEALRASAALAPAGWWRRPPFLPIPEPSYLSWRVHTAYGSEAGPVATDDVVAYLEWRRRQRSQG